jgi:hypothetical protein
VVVVELVVVPKALGQESTTGSFKSFFIKKTIKNKGI